MTYYVNTRSGDDGNDGKTPITAFKTVDAAKAVAVAGDWIYGDWMKPVYNDNGNFIEVAAGEDA